MKLITKLAISAGLTASFAAAPAMAGPLDVIKDKAKSEAKKEVRKEMKKQAVDKVVGATGMETSTVSTAVDGGEKALEMTGVIDKVSSSKSDSEGGMMDKAMSMAKDSMKKSGDAEKMGEEMASESSDDGHKMKKMKDKMMSMPSGDKVIQKGAPAEMAPAPAPVSPPVNCPSGTTAQDDGTCMITGDFNM